MHEPVFPGSRRLGPQHSATLGTLAPITDWPLPLVARLEVAAPGFLLHALRAPPRWRQALYVAFSCGLLERPETFLLRANGGTGPNSLLEDLGTTLRVMNAEAILAAAIGSVPDGLKGALTKLGMHPMSRPESYVRLVGLLGSKAEPQRVKCLAQLSRLDEGLLDSLLTIDPIGLHPEVILHIRHGQEAAKFNARLQGLRSLCSTATNEALAQSISDSVADFRPSRWLRSWLEKADSPATTCDALDCDKEFERVTAANSKSVGLRFQNCIATKTPRLLSAAWSAWVWTPGPLIAALTQVEGGRWLCTGVHGPRNMPVSREQFRNLRDRLTGHGVHCYLPVEEAEHIRPLVNTFAGWQNIDVEEFEIEFEID